MLSHGQVRLFLHIEENEMPQNCRNRKVKLTNQDLNLKAAELALNTSISRKHQSNIQAVAFEKHLWTV